MTESLGTFAEVGVAQTLQWLQAERGVAGELQSLEEREGVGLARLLLSDPSANPEEGGKALTRQATLALIPLFSEDGETEARSSALAEALADEDGLVLWTPPEAPVPEASDAGVVERIRDAASTLSAGERGEVGFPVRLAVRKVGDEGSYLSVHGGLSPHWARFTGQVLGQFQLDSTAIHRLPEDPAAVTQLVDFTVLVANGIRTAGETADVPAEDRWSVQRLAGLAGARVIAASPGSEPEQGTPVRKALRAGTRSALRALEGREGAVRLLTYVGVFRSMAEETASIALRGLDPTVFAQFDAACLAADGQLRVLFGPKAESRLGGA